MVAVDLGWLQTPEMTALHGAIVKATGLNEDQILSLLKISSLSPISIKLKKIDGLIELAKKNNSNNAVVNFLERCREYYE